MTLRIVTYNIRKGGRPRQQLIGEVLAQLDADIVVLEEAIDYGVVRDVARAVRGEVTLAMPGRSVAVISRIGALDADWGHSVRGPRYLQVRLPEQGLRLIGLHLTAGLSGRGERRRLRELDHVLAAARHDAGPDDVVIAGDFNAVAPGDMPAVHLLPRWIRILLRIDGGISTRVMERLATAGFADAFRCLHPDQLGATLPAMAPVVRLDYFLLGAAVVPRLRSCEVPTVDPVLLSAASDHLPLVLELERLRPAVAATALAARASSAAERPAEAVPDAPASKPQQAARAEPIARNGSKPTMAP